jgi:hypothetical protein
VEGKALRDGEGLHAESGRIAGEFASGESAGVADVVDDPDAQVALFGFVDEHAEEGEVLGREVFEGEIDGGLDGDGAEAEPLDLVEVALDFGLGDGSAEIDVGLGAVFGWRATPGSGDFGGGGDCELRGLGLQRGGKQQEGAEEELARCGAWHDSGCLGVEVSTPRLFHTPANVGKCDDRTGPLKQA